MFDGFDMAHVPETMTFHLHGGVGFVKMEGVGAFPVA